MRRFFKFLKYSLIVLGLIALTLFAVAEFAEDRIAQISINQINESVGLPVSYGDIDFSLLRDFPHATLEINDVWLGSPASDSTKSTPDTLANVQKIFIAVKIWPLIREQKFDIMEIDVEEAEGYYLVDADGNSNIDFLIDTTKNDVVNTTSARLKISLRELDIEKMILHYQDFSRKVNAKLAFPEVSFNGRFTNGIFESSVEGTALLSECGFEETNLCLMQQTTMDFDLEYIKDSLKIKEATIKSDGARINISGLLGLSGPLYSMLEVEAPKLNLGELIKYVPENLLYEYGINKIGGNLTFAGEIEGTINDSTMPNMDFSFELKQANARIEGYPPLKNITLSGNYDNGILSDLSTTTIDLNSLNIETQESQLELKVVLHNLKNLNYAAKIIADIDLDEVKKYYIPDSLARVFNGRMKSQLISRGNIPETIDSTFIDFLALNTSGSLQFQNVNFKNDSFPGIDSCSFAVQYSPYMLTLDSLSVQVPDYLLKITQGAFRTNFDGSFSNYAQMTIKADSITLTTPKSNITAGLFLSNLQQPEFNLTSNISLDLNELTPIIPDSINILTRGRLEARLKSAGKLNPDSISEKMPKILFEQSSLNATFQNLSIEMPDTLMGIKNLSGKLTMANDTVKINKINGRYAGIDFWADSASIIHAYATLMQQRPETLILNGKFAIDHLDYSALAVFMNNDTTTTSRKTGETNTPALKYQIKGTAATNSFRYNKSLIENLSCKFNLSDSLYIIDQLKFDAFGGHLNNSIRYETTPNDRAVISFRSKIDSMDIATLLYEFDNFDQKEISHQQISGRFFTQMNGRFLMHGDSLLMDSARIKGDLKLVDGALMNYPRAMELGDFTNLEELDNIQFKTMETQLFVFNNAMYVPKTNIRSNSMNISAYGMQTFGEDYQYHLRIYLGEILHGKTKRIRKKQEELEDNPDDKKPGLSSLYIQSSSIKGKSKNGLDKKSDRLQMQTKINVQEGILNIIFHPLLVDFETGVKMEVPPAPQKIRYIENNEYAKVQ